MTLLTITAGDTVPRIEATLSDERVSDDHLNTAQEVRLYMEAPDGTLVANDTMEVTGGNTVAYNLSDSQVGQAGKYRAQIVVTTDGGGTMTWPRKEKSYVIFAQEAIGRSGTVESSLEDVTLNSVTANSVHAEYANTEIESVGQTLAGGGPLQSEQSFGRLPTQWTDEGVIFSDSGVDTITFTGIVEAGKHVSNPLGAYYLYYAGYHSGDVRLAYSDSIESGWTVYSGNPIVTTSDHGDLSGHVSSPWVLYDPFSDELVMFAHTNKGGAQQSVKFTSSDGENWTYQGQILTPNQDGRWDSYQRGYLRAYRYGNMFVGLYHGHKKGSTEGAQVGVAWSPDGDDWRTSRSPLFHGRHSGSNTTVGYSRASLVNINGTLHVIAANGATSTVDVGPIYDLEQPEPAMQSTNLEFDVNSYSAFRGQDKLYVTGGPGTDVKLYSKEWGELL